MSPTTDYPKSDLIKNQKQMLQQNGTARNVVIARSKDLILSPDPSSKENGNCKNVDKTDSITTDEEVIINKQ